MLSLENKEWNEFHIEDIGEIFSGKDIYDSERVKGLNPYVSATSKNNGVGYFVNNSNHTFEKKCLSVNRNGSVGYSFYHPYKALFSNDCRKLKLKYNSDNVGFFISNQITKQREKYNYGYKMGTERLKRQIVLLPTNEEKTPDYKYMEKYTKLLINKKLEDYKKYCKRILKDIELKEILSIENKEWEEFFIGGENGLFNITSTLSGIDKNKLIFSDNGQIPYITRTDINNGINLFIPDNQLSKYKKNDGNVITIGLDTQTVFYQAHSFFTGQNIQVMKHNLLNKYNALFLIPLIKIQMEKFNWGGNGATLGRLARTKIMLPINKKNEPDFEYMEQYMKNMTYKKINQYLNYLQKQNIEK